MALLYKLPSPVQHLLLPSFHPHNASRLHLPHSQAVAFSFRHSCSTRARLRPQFASQSAALRGFNSGWDNTALKCGASATTPTRETGDLSEQVDSGLPEYFEELSKEKLDPPNYFLWAAGLVLIYITRDTILIELVRWAAAGGKLVLFLIDFAQSAIQKFLGKASKPVELTIALLGSAVIFAKFVYTVIVAKTNAWAMVKSLVLCTTVLSLGEATKSNAVSEQLFMLNLASLLGAGAVLGFLRPSNFCVLLFALAGFSFLVKRRDAVSSFMPTVLVLTAVSEPWVKGVALSLFLACAIYRYWKAPEEVVFDDTNKQPAQPTLLVVVAVMVGMKVAAECLCAWHLLWLSK